MPDPKAQPSLDEHADWFLRLADDTDVPPRADEPVVELPGVLLNRALESASRSVR
jgi:hypothetical protein